MEQAAAVAQTSIMQVWSVAGNFVALIVLTLVLLAFALKAGRASFISLMLSFYVSFGLFMVFPWKAQLIQGEGSTQAAAAILIFFALAIVPFMILRRINTLSLMRIHPVPLTLLCAVSAASLLALSYRFLHIAKILPATPPLETYILPEQFLFYWLIAPLVGFFIFAK